MMFTWIPLTRYQIRMIKGYLAIVSAALTAILLLGNVIMAMVSDRVKVPKGSYVLRDGFPLFTDAGEYIRVLKSYPHNAGVSIKVHHMAPGESYWDVAYQYRVTIDTLIAANPFIRSLTPRQGIDIVVPCEDGVLMAFDDMIDVLRMKMRLDFSGDVRGDFLPTPFKIISTDDIRFVFFKGARPAVVNSAIEQLYKIKNIFQSPVMGNFTSLFGDRVHPFMEEGMIKYHNGVDIGSNFGTPIFPAREGMVIFTGWRGGFGKTIMIQHYDGYTTLYGHLSSINVKNGDWVTMKDMIGRVGSTGWSTGPHLHFTIMRHGRDLNPLYFIW
jgi:murein DD-endopeptidase MepM/ murein hydrolase activator NlpD